MPDPSNPGASFGALPGVFIAVIVLIVLVGVGTAVYRSTRMARRGQNPLTVPEDVAYGLTRSGGAAAGRPKAERLAELDAMLERGGITQAERDAARARILAE